MMLQAFSSRRSRSSRGFTLVELAIVLAVSGLLFAGLWRLMSGSSQEMRDQAAADQMQQVVDVVKTYMATDAGKKFRDDNITASPWVTQLTLSTIPAEFWGNLTASSVNSYGQGYAAAVKKIVDASNNEIGYAFLIVTTGGSDPISDTSGGRISGLIGGSGGFIYNTDVCGAGTAGNTVCGAYGGWNVALSDYGLSGSTGAGHIGSLTSILANVSNNEDIWLARILHGTDTGYDPTGTYDPANTGSDMQPPDENTMHTNMYFMNPSYADYATKSGGKGTNMYLGGNTIYGGSDSGTRSGVITNITSLDVTQTANDVTAFTVNAACNKANINDNTCDFSAAIHGDLAITGLAKANALYSATFVYDVSGPIPSDIRLKSNIRPIQNALDKIGKIKAVTFIMKSTKREKMGVLAQDVEKVYPSLVHEIGDGYKGVDYMGLIGPLVGAVHELKKQNDELRKQVESLSDQIQQLDNRDAASNNQN